MVCTISQFIKPDRRIPQQVPFPVGELTLDSMIREHLVAVTPCICQRKSWWAWKQSNMDEHWCCEKVTIDNVYSVEISYVFYKIVLHVGILTVFCYYTEGCVGGCEIQHF